MYLTPCMLFKSQRWRHADIWMSDVWTETFQHHRDKAEWSRNVTFWFIGTKLRQMILDSIQTSCMPDENAKGFKIKEANFLDETKGMETSKTMNKTLISWEKVRGFVRSSGLIQWILMSLVWIFLVQIKLWLSRSFLNFIMLQPQTSHNSMVAKHCSAIPVVGILCDKNVCTLHQFPMFFRLDSESCEQQCSSTATDVALALCLEYMVLQSEPCRFQ